MRGQRDPQVSIFNYFSPESRGPEDHPLRRVKNWPSVPCAISADLDALHSSVGRPSISPERLLKGPIADCVILDLLGPPALRATGFQHCLSLVS